MLTEKKSSPTYMSFPSSVENNGVFTFPIDARVAPEPFLNEPLYPPIPYKTTNSAVINSIVE